MGKRLSKSTCIFIVIGALLFAYLGYLVGGAWEKNITYVQFIPNIQRVLASPFANHFSPYTIACIGIILFIYTLFVLVQLTNHNKKFMFGREFGSSKFITPEEANRKIADKKNEFANRILSMNVRMSIVARKIKRNLNLLIIGGAGTGKTYFLASPNLMQLNTSFVVTDPKGDILRTMGGFLKKNGYIVKVINFIDMANSNCYNPFTYIRKGKDVTKLITNLISNTTPKGSSPNDPFWEKAESMFLQSIFLYVWLETPPSKRNFATVMELLNEADVPERGSSILDIRFRELEESSPLGKRHPAIKAYNKCMRGAKDTVRSIVISANARLSKLEDNEVLRILSNDDMHLSETGLGVNNDGQTKTVIFCVIPDDDDSYNFVIGMLYTQLFQELYRAAFFRGGRLSIHVTFLLDEFANVALPDGFTSLLSSMRSREISCIIIIQNMAQIKELFEKSWETIPGNCDTLIYLGGNEQSTHEYISKMLGKGTIDKRSNGKTHGKQGSSSQNDDKLGRELMTSDEVQQLDNSKCIIFIRGMRPILDDKYIPDKHPLYEDTGYYTEEDYEHNPEEEIKTAAFTILNQVSYEYYKKLSKTEENVFVATMTLEQLELLAELSEEEQKKEFMKYATEDTYEDMQLLEDNLLKDNAEILVTYDSDTIMDRLARYTYSSGQIKVIYEAIDIGMSQKEILTFLKPQYSADYMQSIVDVAKALRIKETSN